MIELYFANPGAGKTTYLAKLAQKYTKKKWYKKSKKYNAVYCNAPIHGTKMFDVNKDLGVKHIENALLLIDEGAIVLDNRIPLKEVQKTFLRLHRHYKVDIVVVSQSWEDINIVVRRLYDKIYLMNRTIFKHITTIRKIKKCIDISEDGQIQDMYKFSLFGLRFFNRKLYYRFFNSYDRPQLKITVDKIWNGKLPKTKIQKLQKQLKAFKNKIRKILNKDIKVKLNKKKVEV